MRQPKLSKADLKMMKKEGVRTFFKLLQNKINEYSAKRYKKDERSSSQYKEL
jgi:hypothetical protein